MVRGRRVDIDVSVVLVVVVVIVVIVVVVVGAGVVMAVLLLSAALLMIAATNSQALRPEAPCRAMDIDAEHVCVVCLVGKPDVLFPALWACGVLQRLLALAAPCCLSLLQRANPGLPCLCPESTEFLDLPAFRPQEHKRPELIIGASGG